MSLKPSSAMRLEIDESIIHSQLKFNKEDEEFQQLLSAAISERDSVPVDDFPYKTVKPKPGLCAKTQNIITSQKVFVNICHTTIIPAPADITESELTRILESDEPSTFRIPMSLGEGHEEVDKSGQPCIAYDVAINSKFFEKVESSLLFQTFLITIAMEGLEDKYKMELDKNGWNILKHRRCFGSMQLHRIEQRNEKPYVQEVPKKSQLKDVNNLKLIEEVDQIIPKTNTSEHFQKATPWYALVSTPDGIKLVVARIPIFQSEIGNISLSVVSNDCVSVKGEDGQNIVNVSLPYSVDPQKSKAIFNKTTKVLTVLLPLI